jgi:hypothetical protein
MSSLRWATKNEWLGLLDVAELDLEALYGAFDGEPFDDESSGRTSSLSMEAAAPTFVALCGETHPRFALTYYICGLVRRNAKAAPADGFTSERTSAATS